MLFEADGAKEDHAVSIITGADAGPRARYDRGMSTLAFVTRPREDLDGSIEVIPTIDGALLTDLIHAFEMRAGMETRPESYSGLFPEHFDFGPLDLPTSVRRGDFQVRSRRSSAAPAANGDAGHCSREFPRPTTRLRGATSSSRTEKRVTTLRLVHSLFHETNANKCSEIFKRSSECDEMDATHDGSGQRPRLFAECTHRCPPVAQCHVISCHLASHRVGWGDSKSSMISSVARERPPF